MPQLLDDPFADSTATNPQPASPATVNRPDAATVEANFEALNERRATAERAAVARRNAAIARSVAQAFSEYGRAFTKVAETKGSEVDHAVAVFLAAICSDQVDHYTAAQARYASVADREGSL